MSNKTMSITEINNSSKSFKDTHTIQVGGFGKQKQPPKWFVDFANEMLNFVKRQEEFNKRQDEFNKAILARIDNLVAKNNLKE